VFLVDFMHQRAGFGADAYCITVEQLRAAMKRNFHRYLRKVFCLCVLMLGLRTLVVCLVDYLGMSNMWS